ncbi:hypothetical protein QLX67_10455 [Balneolaceae bacterium ANBcel3]|nr:hypothetical protein [Balneolaceae bacterium ANBcel3]
MDEKQSLENLLITLQKSISRVMDQSAKNHKEQDRRTALIVGDVDFELKMKLSNEKDRFFLDKNGEIELNLHGKIDPDLKEEEYE